MDRALQGMKIRPSGEADVSRVVSFSLRAWAPVFGALAQVMDGGVFQTFYPNGWREQQERSVKTVFDDPSHHVWIAELKGLPIGFVPVVRHPDDNTGEISMIAVDPDHHNVGVGIALIEFALDWVKKEGMAIAMVETGGILVIPPRGDCMNGLDSGSSQSIGTSRNSSVST